MGKKLELKGASVILKTAIDPFMFEVSLPDYALSRGRRLLLRVRVEHVSAVLRVHGSTSTYAWVQEVSEKRMLQWVNAVQECINAANGGRFVARGRCGL